MGLGKELGLASDAEMLQTAEFSLDELEERQKAKERKSDRVNYSANIVLRPGNSSQRKEHLLNGTCKDVSSGGCCLLIDGSPRVGDVYHVETPDEISGPIHGKHIRCVRCVFLDEDLFEAAFTFFTPIQLVANKQTAKSNRNGVDDILGGLG